MRIAPAFGGINLEDISAPRCFEIERQLQERLDIPVFHDDQHGTAIVVLAALRNAARLTGRALGDLRVVVSGAGAAGVAVTTILREAGIGDIAVADRKGVLHDGRGDLTAVKRQLAAVTNDAGLHRHPGRRAARRRRLHRRLRRHRPGGGGRRDGARRDRLRAGQPAPGDPPRRGPPVRAGRRHRAQRLPQPDQQRAGLPGHLPRGARRAGHRRSPRA